MITACGYTSKFNQATLGTSSSGSSGFSLLGTLGTSQTAGPAPNLCWCGTLAHLEAELWGLHILQSPCGLWRGGGSGFLHLQPHRSGDTRGQWGPVPSTPCVPRRRPALLRLWNTTQHLSFSWDSCPGAGAAPCKQGTSPQHLKTTSQDAESQAGFKTQTAQEARMVWGFIANGVPDLKLFLRKHMGWKNPL